MAAEKIRQVELVGRKIRRLRKERKLTQSELSARIGIQQSDLSRIERGEYRVSLDTLFSILAEFKVGIGEFFDESDAHLLHPRDILLIERFNALSSDAQRGVNELVAFKRSRPRHGGEGPQNP